MTKTDSTTKNKCDWCGNYPVNIKRRYKGEGYCANCYKTWLTKQPCSRCNKLSRLHKKEHEPICRECIKNQPCKRCGNDASINGANTEYGRVCQICWQGYFKKKKTCQECGEDKAGVSRYTELPHDNEICVSCYQRETRATCSACRRFRKVIGTPKGALCEKCHEFGEVGCPCCGGQMPAGFGKRCWDCYWSSRLQREVEVNLYLFKSDKIKAAYKDFINWFIDRTCNQKVAMEHLKFTTFFKTCDEVWHEIPSYNSLVQEFKPEGLRHHLTVLRWLIDTEQVIVNLDIKNEIAEKERILNLLNKLEVLPESIETYYEFLDKKLALKKTSLKSIRLALQPAIGIYVELSVDRQQQPSQEQLDTYLRLKQGQYNAIYGFISFLNKNYKLQLVCVKPNKDELKKLKKKELERKIIEISSKPKPLSAKDEIRWLQLAMAYFHKIDLKLNIIKNLSVQQCDGEMLKVAFNNKEYCLPKL